ncbi:Ig-like domain-containing protein [Peribacillus frigoritolerans]|uniref:Ig-like domain-containing protein n=1 Tax=Peribacillus frigoritolerans TaxID=450367 RepID=UPI003305BC0D
MKNQLVKHFLSVFIIISLVCSFTNKNVLANADTTPPILEKVEINTKKVHAGEEVTVYITPKDDISGVQYIALINQSPSNTQTVGRNLWSTDEQGRYVYTFKVGENAEAGKWKINSISLIDNANNTSTFWYGTDYIIDYEVINPSADTTPPILEKVEINTKKVHAGEEVTVYITPKDDISGVQYIALINQSPSNTQTVGRNLWSTDEQGRYVYTFKVGENAEAGKWKINSISLIDNANNTSTFWYGTDYIIDYEVINPSADTTPPILEKVEINTKKVHAGEEVTVYITPKDDISGVQYIALINQSPSNTQTVGRNLWSTDEQGRYVYTFKVGENAEAGKWKINSISLIDNANNTSTFWYGTDYIIDYEVINPSADTIPPSQPIINQVTENSTSMTGTAEVGSSITIKAGMTVIGTATVDTEGNYTVTIPKQKAGTKLTVTATDEAGNISEVKEVTVKDVTAPSVPTVNTVYDNATVISGKAESSAKVYAMVGSKKIGEATAKNGAYTIKIAKQKAGTSISVYATDTSVNKSGSKTVKVIDKTPPSTPTVNTVYDNATVISGKAESSAKVYAMVGSKKIGEATAKNGAYTIKIAKQKAGTSISVYATDTSVNKSGSKTVKVIDKTPPSTPTLNKITSKTVTVTGKGEKRVSIYIYNGSKKIGQGIVDGRGYFKVKIKAQKKGSSLKVYAQDKSGNKSKSKTVKVS